jgi:hypothetical protein
VSGEEREKAVTAEITRRAREHFPSDEAMSAYFREVYAHLQGRQPWDPLGRSKDITKFRKIIEESPAKAMVCNVISLLDIIDRVNPALWELVAEGKPVFSYETRRVLPNIWWSLKALRRASEIPPGRDLIKTLTALIDFNGQAETEVYERLMNVVDEWGGKSVAGMEKILNANEGN